MRRSFLIVDMSKYSLGHVEDSRLNKVIRGRWWRAREKEKRQEKGPKERRLKRTKSEPREIIREPRENMSELAGLNRNKKPRKGKGRLWTGEV